MRLATIFYALIFAIMVPSAFVTQPAEAQQGVRPIAQDDIFWMSPEDDSITFQNSDLTLNDSGTHGAIVLLEQNAVHGTAIQQGNTFIYTPSASFWSLRADSFSYTLSGFGGVSTATVRIFRKAPKALEAEQGFEAFEGINYTEIEDPGSSVDVTTGAALLGGQGLEITVGAGSGGHAAAEFPINGDTTDSGGTVLLGGGLNQGGGGTDGDQDPVEVAILTVGPTSEDLENASVRVVLREDGGVRDLRVEVRNISVVPNYHVVSASLPVTEDVNHIAVDWWKGGAMLDLNGQTVRVSGIPNGGLPFSYVRVGAMPLSGGFVQGTVYEYDGFEVRSYDSAEPFPLIFGEGFESATLSAWDYDIGSGMALTGTALTGQQSLEGDLGVGDSFVATAAPNDEAMITARARIDVSQFQTASSTDWITCMQLGSYPNPIFHRDDVQLRLWQPAGQPMIGLGTYSGTAWTHHGWLPLSGEHVVEVQIKNSPSSLVDIGYVRLWIDGVAAAEAYGIDSVSRLTDWMRLGPQLVDPGSSGELIFDDVDLWR